jgi:hypothetical protein
MIVDVIYRIHTRRIVKASNVEKGDVVFSPGEQTGPVKEVYSPNPDIVVISFDGQFGIQCHPDQELLVARKGQIL